MKKHVANLAGFPWLIMVIFIFGHNLSAHAQQTIAVRNSHTGQAIDAQIDNWSLPMAVATSDIRASLKKGQPPESIPALQQAIKSRLSTHQGRIPWHASAHWRLWRIQASGYAPMQILIAPDAVPVSTLWLDPLSGKQADMCQAGQVCGHVMDANTLKPVTDARIIARMGDQSLRGQTDSRGFFRLDIKALASTENSPADTLTVDISSSGRIRQQWQDLFWQPGVHLQVDMKPGQGWEKHSLRHPLADVPQGHVPTDWLQAKLSQQASQTWNTSHHPTTKARSSNLPFPAEHPGGSIFIDPPDSITVGFAADGGYCCGNNCATSQVFSLETYVQKGLDNEWISTWGANSLKAGSVAFRSYGAWHAMESPYSGYDICAGPCCQAFGISSYTSTENAAKATRGIMLEINGALARSEYSAENNAWNDPNDGLSCTNTDLSCGDGYVGSPANGWPCLADNSTSRGCFGHGRGMSQWGTYYHDLDGENWADIVDHYYNAQGNPAGMRSQYATTPVVVLSFATWPQTLNAGTAFDIALSINNAAGLSTGQADFGPILIGASLLGNNASYSDPANDNSLTLTAFGPQTIHRIFQTNSTWPAGEYDLAVALWLDVDNDAVITAADWVLAFQVQTGAITLLAPDDLIFADGF